MLTAIRVNVAVIHPIDRSRELSNLSLEYSQINIIVSDVTDWQLVILPPSDVT